MIATPVGGLPAGVNYTDNTLSAPAFKGDGTALINIGSGLWSWMVPPTVLSTTASTVNDSAYQNLDLSGFVPCGANEVLLELVAIPLASPDIATFLAVRGQGDLFGGPDGAVVTGGDGSWSLYAGMTANLPAQRGLTVRVGTTRVIQYQRVNPNAASRSWAIYLRAFR